jgi:hypothetical protein
VLEKVIIITLTKPLFDKQLASGQVSAATHG